MQLNNTITIGASALDYKSSNQTWGYRQPNSFNNTQTQ